ncbi:FtsK/SpoIIIE domain-containing protein [Pseudobythopirellula maris]|nr:FtsK/SpoIIIE domain-containing protein [Pseudobythopirellula maris]
MTPNQPADTLSTRRQAEMIQRLVRAAKERHEEERSVAKRFEEAETESENRRRRDLREADKKLERAKAAEAAEYKAATERRVAAYLARRESAQQSYQSIRTTAESEAAGVRDSAAQEKNEAAWEILTLFDLQRLLPAERLAEAKDQIAERRDDLLAIGRDAVEIVRMRRQGEAELDLSGGRPVQVSEADIDFDAALAELDQRVEAARAAGQQLYDQRLARLFEGEAPAVIAGSILLAAIVAGGAVMGWTNWVGYTGGVLLAAALNGALWAYFKPKAKRQSHEGLAGVQRLLLEADAALRAATAVAGFRAKAEGRELIDRRNRDLQEVGLRLEQLVGEAAAKASDQLNEAGKLFPAMLSQMRKAYDTELAQAEREHNERLADLTRQRDEFLKQLERDHELRTVKIQEDHEAAWQGMFERWLTRFDDVRAELRDMRAEAQRLFPDFAETAYAEWPKPTQTAPAIRFGRMAIDLENIEHGAPEDERLAPPETRLEAPALMTLSEDPTLLVSTGATTRAEGLDLMRGVMLRFFTAMPPGRVRFTIIDPLGLGDSFQSYMHLADHDELLINGRIWSEPRDIDDQLVRLTNHMETVLQKYLRSEYETIHEYNAQAGEVAEPFQVLVIAGFPTNFSESAARRLESIITGGPRCGVYTLLGIDNQKRLPNEFRLDEVKSQAVWIEENPRTKRLEWRRPEFQRLPIRFESPPPPEQMIEVLKAAGQAAKEAVKVEVPFSVVAPPADEMWSRECSVELRVPVGRAGAKSLQDVRLGKGTSQHLLVAGKTGSGKSTFLHALVTSAAMHFGPDEVEFYLVDFKKGVEFKSYATHRLPHARVIAIESEREFGISVLERLDDELKQRGEKFRAAGVQNLADYREKRPEDHAPRVLLIIDEFQELFVEEDKLSQDAALLLDRLVRQGRAFGVHVLLGTQTLAGAYSIARSTLGQMAVRVALECSESDAHLILSDERNTAARFLTRPGEAIYNAQNGQPTANEPFQVVWLSDKERSKRLDTIDELRHQRELPRPDTIVFEGNAPADLAENTQLFGLASGETPLEPGRPPLAWLGDAVSIKPPTAVAFGRYPGANLLVVGPQPLEAIGMLASAAVSLAATASAANRSGGDGGVRFVVLDGTRHEEEGEGVWGRVAESLDGFSAGVTCRLAEGRAATDAVAEVYNEVVRREAAEANEAPASGADDAPPLYDGPIYLVIHNAGRFRDLRRMEDDFSFSSNKDEPPAPDKQLAAILRDGPAVGIHTLVWCDSYNSVTRMFDRAALREFAMRVAMQLSSADSSHLIDTPAASTLKSHRAIFYNDETGQSEKFRPYAPPEAELLSRLAKGCKGAVDAAS